MFSVIIPTYNHAKYLIEALDSVICQTYPDWEIVIVNDGSTDNTREIIEDYARRDQRIHPFHKFNGGTASAINLGLEKAHGEWICWLSSDDWFEPDKLETHKRYIDHYPDCDFFFSHFHMFDEYEGKLIDRDLFGPLPERELQIPALLYRNYVMGVGICARRRVWGQVGVMDNSLKYAQDYDMWLRILTISPGIFIPERTFTYRHHPGQGSETFQLGCLFDASKSGIRYINNHSFKEFFPFLDLSDEYSAIKALTKSLEVASDPSAYLYSLGPHPAFVLRLLEWLGKQEGSFREKLDGIVKQYSTMVNDKYPGTRFGNIWNNTIALYVDQNPLVYKPVSNLAVALDNYFHCLSVNHPLTAPLMKYLENYEGIRLEGITPQAYYPIRGELLQKYFIEPNFTALLDHAQQAGSEQNNSLISKFASILKGLSK